MPTPRGPSHWSAEEKRDLDLLRVQDVCRRGLLRKGVGPTFSCRLPSALFSSGSAGSGGPPCVGTSERRWSSCFCPRSSACREVSTLSAPQKSERACALMRTGILTWHSTETGQALAEAVTKLTFHQRWHNQNSNWYGPNFEPAVPTSQIATASASARRDLVRHLPIGHDRRRVRGGLPAQRAPAVAPRHGLPTEVHDLGGKTNVQGCSRAAANVFTTTALFLLPNDALRPFLSRLESRSRVLSFGLRRDAGRSPGSCTGCARGGSTGTRGG